MKYNHPARPKIVRKSAELRNWLYESAVAEPYTWLMQSESFLRAARYILECVKSDIEIVRESPLHLSSPPVYTVYLMLAGMALENLMKGILATKNPELRAEEFIKMVGFHNLNQLLVMINYDIGSDEGLLLEKVTAHVVWAGRYTVPKRPEDFLPRCYPRGGWGPPTTFSIEGARMIEELDQRLKELFKSCVARVSAPSPKHSP